MRRRSWLPILLMLDGCREDPCANIPDSVLPPESFTFASRTPGGPSGVGNYESTSGTLTLEYTSEDGVTWRVTYSVSTSE
jgi:hypothetical protein